MLIEIPDELAHAAMEIAEQNGIPVEELLVDILREHLLTPEELEDGSGWGPDDGPRPEQLL